jgi:hypothetical protein
MDLAPMTLEEREERLKAAGAVVNRVLDGAGLLRPAEDGPEPIPACEVVLEDGRKFFAFGATEDQARDEAFSRAEEALAAG